MLSTRTGAADSDLLHLLIPFVVLYSPVLRSDHGNRVIASVSVIVVVVQAFNTNRSKAFKILCAKCRIEQSKELET